MTGSPDAEAPVRAMRRALEGGLLPAGQHLLVALSGGRDSSALLHVLRRLDAWPLTAAVVDHGLHGESETQARLAVDRARAQGVQAALLSADPHAIARGAGPEAGARDERYRLLHRHADAVGAIYIVTAHTADDQAETLLMRLAEGSGSRGMGGIPPRRGRIVRPWLHVGRAEVWAYAAREGVRYSTDPTNADPRYRRNAIRRSAVPAIDACFDPRWVHRAASTAEHMRGAALLLDWMLDRAPDVVRRAGERIEISRAALDALPAAARRALVDRAMRDALGQGARRRRQHVAAVAALEPGERRALPGGWAGRGTGAAIVIEPDGPPLAPTAPLVVTGPGRWRWGAWVLEIGAPVGAGGDAVACQAAPFPWRVRGAEPGERMRPLGGTGSRALRRLWADRGVPRRWRSALPVVESDGRVIWAAGLRVADAVRVRETEAALWVAVREPPDGPGLGGVIPEPRVDR